MPMHPRPIAETSGPCGPSVRFSMTLSFRLVARRLPGRARRSRARYINAH